MNEWRRLHVIYMLFGLLNTVKGFLPLLVLLALRGEKLAGLEWYWYAGAAALAAVILVISFFQWRRFEFRLEEDRIVIRKGLVFRDEKTIYYGRVHSVNVEQPLIQRLLRVAQVKIETPGGKTDADGVLPALSLKEAAELQQLLKGQAKAQLNPPETEESKTEDGETKRLSVRMSINGVELASPELAGHTLKDEASTAKIQLGTTQLLQAAATSMNFGLVAAFVAGLYSFADDFMDALFPAHFFEKIYEDSISAAPSYLLVTGIAIFALVFAWLLSTVLYVLKYSGFTAQRSGRQIQVSYGLLEKKSFVFDPKKVQAVKISESPLRQLIGLSAIQLQVISSIKSESLMLHPCVKNAEISKVLADFVPQLQFPEPNSLQPAPKRALLYYLRTPLMIAIALCIALIAIFKMVGVWSLLIIPIIIWWRSSCHRAAGARLEQGQLTLRRRIFSRTTCLIRRPQIVTMDVRRTKKQQKKRLFSLSVYAMGGLLDFRVAHLEQADVEPIWRWFSRSGKS